MLKKINEGRVESDSGFSIHITGLECLKYEDANQTIEFEWNYDSKTNKTYVYVSDVKAITEEEEMIMNRVKYFENMLARCELALKRDPTALAAKLTVFNDAKLTRSIY